MGGPSPVSRRPSQRRSNSSWTPQPWLLPERPTCLPSRRTVDVPASYNRTSSSLKQVGSTSLENAGCSRDVLSGPHVNCMNRSLEDLVATEAAAWELTRPFWTSSYLLLPGTPPRTPSSTQPCSAPGFPSWLVSVLYQQEMFSLILFGVNKYHAHDKLVSSCCNRCHLQGSLAEQPAASDFFQVISPRTLPRCRDWVAGWHSPLVTLALPGACARRYLQKLQVR